ncbi:MAG TPA: GNAT family N-acetyltransferase [Acidimicrobiales bacterium]|nr:GNAT family N-acetyltransferase [Acidimicrobiales bacterium]
MIPYSSFHEGVTEASLRGGFFEGWPAPPSAAEHVRLLREATHAVLAWEGGAVVGFVTALSDGVLTAYIPLLEVLPSHRGQGIGSELVRRLLGDIGPLYMIDVMCDPAIVPFYEHLGFSAATGAVMRNR